MNVGMVFPAGRLPASVAVASFCRESLLHCRREGGVACSRVMDEPASLPTVTVTVRTVDADTIFSALGDPTRRRILAALADGQFRTAQSFGGVYPKHYDLTRKHLAVLVKAGLVVAAPNPADQRRQHYKLAPFVKTAVTPEGGRTMDFGYCVLRCP